MVCGAEGAGEGNRLSPLDTAAALEPCLGGEWNFGECQGGVWSMVHVVG